MEDRRIKLYSYKKFWRVEKKIYSFQNIVLPVPVNPYDVLYFMIVFFISFLIGKIIPAYLTVPVVIRCIAIPYAVTNYIRKKKLDGKNPIKYFRDYIKYIFTEKGNYFEGFKKNVNRKEVIHLSWKCSVGRL